MQQPEFLRKRSVESNEMPQPSPVKAPKNVIHPATDTDEELGEERRSSRTPNSVFEIVDEARPMWKVKVEAALDGACISMFTTTVTIWALFGDDVRLLTNYDKTDGDAIFSNLTIFCLITFSLELFLASIAKEQYFLGFYFWLETVATLSLIMDIPEAFEAIMGIEETSSSEDLNGSTGGGGDDGSASQATESAELARAGRTSRAGTRAGRIVRLVRLVRILKLYKQYMNANSANPEVVEEEEEEKESRVGHKLSDLTTRRVIIGVLLMLFGLQLFDTQTYNTEETSLMVNGLDLVVKSYENCNTDEPCPAFFRIMTSYIEQCTQSDGSVEIEPYWIVVNGTSYNHLYGFQGGDHPELRSSEFEETSTGTSFAKFDKRKASMLQAWMNMCKTIFVCIVLGAGAMSFSRDANMLVLHPLERIFNTVKEMAENPLAKVSAKEKEEEKEEEELLETMYCGYKSKKTGVGLETNILETTFLKMCRLMALGFGDAGAEIIAENMQSAGGLDPMVPGTKMVAIFGFCDIRQFTDATEVLQEGVMEFVNSIGRVVHMEVALHGGSANKNIGDAFLLVWKFPRNIMLSDVENVKNGEEKEGSAIHTAVSTVADKALASFIVITAMLKKSRRLCQYSLHPGLNKRMPGPNGKNYMVRMGYGLHVGWAIEGAIGSTYKVDASYLSPNVNMASRLEAATKQFGTGLLLSEDFVAVLSRKSRKWVRQIDRVTVKGSDHPMGLFTYDVDIDALKTGEEIFTDDKYETPMNFTSSNREFQNEFEEHPDILATRGATIEYIAQFEEAFHFYRRGDWPSARDVLNKCEIRVTPSGARVQDGPTASLLSVLAEHNYRAPASWTGYRALTEK